MKLADLNKEYDKLQQIYGDPTLHSIYNGGCINKPDICLIFMNPTKRNIASLPTWDGPHYPWLGTKNIYSLFYDIGLISENIYQDIRAKKGNEWSKEFCEEVYSDLKSHRVFITNLGKCTQIDARPLKDDYFKNYLPLLEKEISIVKPKVVILFGNQVSSIFLNKKITVSQTRKKYFEKNIDNVTYKCFPVYYPVGNGHFNIDKAIEDLNYIIKNYVRSSKWN